MQELQHGIQPPTQACSPSAFVIYGRRIATCIGYQVDICGSDTFLEKTTSECTSNPIATMDQGAGEWSISGSLGRFSGSVSCPKAVQMTEATPPVVHLMSKYVNSYDEFYKA